MDKIDTKNLEISINSLSEEVNSLKGKVSLLEEQYIESENLLQNLKEEQEVNKKSIELLNLVSKVTTELIKEMFETIVTNALQYIYQSNDYKFELEFGKRGNLNELKFNIKKPEMQLSHDILDTNAGGNKDVVALALREVLLEVSQMPGFLFLDEPEKRLDSPETLKRMIEFIKKLQQKTNRQVFVITHKQEFVDSVTNPIIFEKAISVNNQKCRENEIEQKPKKKRGRPRKND